MKHITSRDNPLFKELKLLASNAQVRRKTGKTLLEGVHLCQVYLQKLGLPSLVIIGESGVHDSEVATILAACESRKGQCLVLPDSLYKQLSQVENGVELLFVIDTPSSNTHHLTEPAILLDNLQDPGNLGSILRSAAAAGIGNVYCSKGTVFSWSPKVLRAGMGAHFWLNIVENADLDSLLRSAKIPVLATSSHATMSLYQTDLRGPVAWLFGHEGRGVSEELLMLATHQIAIPHQTDVESLNVAASAAVCFFEQVRQRLQ